MKSLLDTQILLWALVAPDRLPPEARDLIENEAAELYFSAVSIWEIAIKSGLGRSDFDVDPMVFRRALIDNGYTELPITSRHAAGVLNLPSIHKDPFDRLLIAQALAEGIWLYTTDSFVVQYSGPIRKVT